MAWVLVVDDDEATCETLRLLLEEHGYTVAEAPDGQAALEMLRSTPFHAIILFDLMMPILDGKGLIDEVRKDPALAQRHAYILMSADHNALRALSEESFGDVTVSILRKPFDIDALLNLVRREAQRLPGAV